MAETPPPFISPGWREEFLIIDLISFCLQVFPINVLSMLCIVYNLTSDVKNDKATNCSFCLKLVKAPSRLELILLARALPSHILLSVT